ncbi:MAG: hypothetical protein Q9168_007230 [Polycauliona sp. 1 TL-2023]
MASVNQKAINLWTARVIPVILAGIVGYATWVVVVLVCGQSVHLPLPTSPADRVLVDYLLNPSPTVREPRRGAGIAILTIYACLLLLLAFTYFRLIYTVIANPGFTPRGPQWHAQNSSKSRRRRSTRATEPPPDLEKQNGSLGGQPASSGAVSNSSNGPAYSEWGPAADASPPGLQDFYNRDVFTCESDGRPIWAALFSLFLLGMSGSSLQFVFLNTTTIENLSRKTKVWQLAVLMPPVPAHSYNPPPYRTITYGQQDDPNTNMRTFAILHSKPGENPWDLGSFRNFKSVMGENWYDWFLPIKPSPCAKHERPDCEFETGDVVDRMKVEVGIISPPHTPIDDEKPRRHRRRRRRRRSTDPAAVEENEHDRRERRKQQGRRPHEESRRDSGVER